MVTFQQRYKKVFTTYIIMTSISLVSTSILLAAAAWSKLTKKDPPRRPIEKLRYRVAVRAMIVIVVVVVVIVVVVLVLLIVGVVPSALQFSV